MQRNTRTDRYASSHHHSDRPPGCDGASYSNIDYHCHPCSFAHPSTYNPGHPYTYPGTNCHSYPYA